MPVGAWPNWVLGNHDRHRVASRVGPNHVRLAQMLLLTLRGTPTCYYGDEIGMTNVTIPDDRVQDPWERNVPGHGLGRDPERTPMQWDASAYAGFSTVEPWLPLASNYRQVNVAVERDNPGSMLCFFHSLVELRRATPALAVGHYSTFDAGNSNVLAYVRSHEGSRILVALNFAAEPALIDLATHGVSAELLLSTHRATSPDNLQLSRLELQGNEGVILRLA